jgi:hypothetical protein
MSGDTVGMIIIFVGYGIIIPGGIWLMSRSHGESSEVSSLKTMKYLLDEMAKEDRKTK